LSVRNGAHTLAACLESLGKLNYPAYEVILVDDGSTDDTAHVAAQFPSVRYIHQANHGLSHARNTGAAAARATYSPTPIPTAWWTRIGSIT
jgi:glycosyltransferase involved in cell wall biosynthesis